MEKIQLKAMGKINLGLDILGKREDGYHDVRMVMQTVYLYDNVTLVQTGRAGSRSGRICSTSRWMRITWHIRQQSF